MLLVFYTYFLGPSSPFFSSLSRASRRAAAQAASPAGPASAPLASPSSPASVHHPSGWGGDALKNRVFFTFMFLEMITWFWIWVTLREERAGLVERLKAARRADRRSARLDHEHDE